MSIPSTSPFPLPPQNPLPERPWSQLPAGRPSGLVGFQRASDADRDRVCDQLAVHYASGRLTAEELDVRLYAAIRAETLIELRQLLVDLAAPGPNLQHRPSAGTPPRRLAPEPYRSAVPWRSSDVLTSITAIGCLGIGLVAITVLEMFGQSWLLGAGFVGGCVAALGGATAMHSVHRFAERKIERERLRDASVRRT